MALVLAFFLVLGSSRGALLATLCALPFIKIGAGYGKYAVAGAGLLLVYVGLRYLSGHAGVDLGFERDVFEETGRKAIFRSYVNEFSSRYFILGTGLVEGGGRIKSELSYLDIMLFSGVGALGYFVFLARSLWFCLIANIAGEAAWVRPSFVFLVVSSVFEGYTANVANLLSIFTYIIAGLAYFYYVQFRFRRNAIVSC